NVYSLAGTKPGPGMCNGQHARGSPGAGLLPANGTHGTPRRAFPTVLLHGPQRDAVFVFDVDAVGGEDGMGEGPAVGDFVARDLFEFRGAWLEDDELSGGCQRHQHWASVDDAGI